MPTITHRTIAAEEKLVAAQARHKRAADRFYDLLGWGTFEELSRAEKSLTVAKKALHLAEARLEKLNNASVVER